LDAAKRFCAPRDDQAGIAEFSFAQQDGRGDFHDASLPQFLRPREHGAINHRDSLEQRRTSNLQTPIAKETPIANSKNPERIARIGCWILKFLWMLELGNWSFLSRC
jgi:hypothetical protein